MQISFVFPQLNIHKGRVECHSCKPLTVTSRWGQNNVSVWPWLHLELSDWLLTQIRFQEVFFFFFFSAQRYGHRSGTDLKAQISLCHCLPVFYKRREELAGKPYGVSHGQHPQDGQLIQHLAHEAESHVKIGREESCKEANLLQTQFWTEKMTGVGESGRKEVQYPPHVVVRPSGCQPGVRVGP